MSLPTRGLCPQGVAGISCLWRAADYWRTRHGLPEQLPARMAERLRPARARALHKVPSLQAAAAEEEAAGGAAAGGAGSEDDEEFDLEEAQAEMMEEAADGSDLSDDGGRGSGWVGMRKPAGSVGGWRYASKPGCRGGVGQCNGATSRPKRSGRGKMPSPLWRTWA